MVKNKLEERIRQTNKMFADLALTQDITEVRFDPQLFRMTRDISHEHSDNKCEQGGFFGGVVRNGIYYIIDHHRRGMNIHGQVTFNHDFREIDLDLFRSMLKAFPDYKTVIYHNHPPVTVWTLIDENGLDASPVINNLYQDLLSGIYESLGITTLSEAINDEFSRILSPTDISNTPGRYNLVISPTYSGGNPNSHLNFYDLKSRLFPRLVRTSVSPETEIAEFNETFERVRKEWSQTMWGCQDMGDLSEEGHVRAFYLLHGLTYPPLNR